MASYLWIEMGSVVWLKLFVASNEFIAMLYGLSYPVVARTWVHLSYATHMRAYVICGLHICGTYAGICHHICGHMW